MGGSMASYGSVSPMTARSMGGNLLSPNWASSPDSTAQFVLFDLVPIDSVGSIVSIHDSSSSNKSELHPPTSVKDKSFDMGIGNITDKDSWLESKKIIDLCLWQALFIPHPTLGHWWQPKITWWPACGRRNFCTNSWRLWSATYLLKHQSIMVKVLRWLHTFTSFNTLREPQTHSSAFFDLLISSRNQARSWLVWKLASTKSLLP